jgi:hypothetical protein
MLKIIKAIGELGILYKKINQSDYSKSDSMDGPVNMMKYDIS